jgi:multidrug resistance efflux pump
MSRDEVDALLAQIEAKRDELHDLCERLAAELAVRQADVAIAPGQLDQAKATFKQAEGLVRKGVTGENTLRGTDLDVQIRTAELDRQKAEAAEVEVRIRQASRQLGVADGLVGEGNAMVVRAFPQESKPGEPAPPPAPASK